MSYFDKTESEIGLLSSMYLLGCCCGALIFSCLAFNYGRKFLFNITIIIYAISVIGVCLSYSYNMLLICRFFTGIFFILYFTFYN